MSNLILASSSATRRLMLERAGVAFSAVSPQVDEDGLKESLLAESVPPRDLVDILAEAKAMSVSDQYPDDLVIGSDQILLHEGKIYSKPTTMDGVRDQMRTLSGSSHQLLSAVVLVRGGQPVWRHIETVRLAMLPLSDAQIDSYLSEIGEAAFWSVGSYQVESVGIQLFEKIEGDFFSILGMPLVPLLVQLRRFGFEGLF